MPRIIIRLCNFSSLSIVLSSLPWLILRTRRGRKRSSRWMDVWGKSSSVPFFLHQNDFSCRAHNDNVHRRRAKKSPPALDVTPYPWIWNGATYLTLAAVGPLLPKVTPETGLEQPVERQKVPVTRLLLAVVYSKLVYKIKISSKFKNLLTVSSE